VDSEEVLASAPYTKRFGHHEGKWQITPSQKFRQLNCDVRYDSKKLPHHSLTGVSAKGQKGKSRLFSVYERGPGACVLRIWLAEAASPAHSRHALFNGCEAGRYALATSTRFDYDLGRNGKSDVGRTHNAAHLPHRLHFT
jgi:hypothetical protein